MNPENNTTFMLPPRLAMINSMAGYGRCSTTIAMPIISAMQVQVCPVPTSVLSNHLGFPICYHEDFTSHMQDYINAWKELQIRFDGLYCGFLANPQQIEIVTQFLEDFQPEIFLLDPVMGDHGKCYATITEAHSNGLKKLLSYADILTPNLTEACLLTETPYHEGIWSKTELLMLCEKLARLCHGRIVITGLEDENSYFNFIWNKGVCDIYSVPKAGTPRHGTGDLFASILIADALHHRDFTTSVKKAADFIALCIRSSDALGVPLKEGIVFENHIKDLLKM